MIQALTRIRAISATLILAISLGIFLCSCTRTIGLSDNGAADFLALSQANKASFTQTYLTFTALGGRDYVAISADFSQTDDALIGIDLSDFMRAGLEPQSLVMTDFGPDFPVYDLQTSTLVLTCHLGDQAFNYGTYTDPQGKPMLSPSADALFSEILRTQASLLSLDIPTRHYRLALGNSASLSWTISTTGVPVSLVLSVNAAPFVKAGLDAGRLEKWTPVPATTPSTLELVFLGK